MEKKKNDEKNGKYRTKPTSLLPHQQETRKKVKKAKHTNHDKKGNIPWTCRNTCIKTMKAKLTKITQCKSELYLVKAEA